MSDEPKPGTPEYDLAMIRKFRSQEIAHDPLTISYREVEGSAGKVRIHSNSLVHGPDPKLNSDAADPAQIGMIERDIAKLKEELAEEVEVLDPETGKRLLRFTGREREIRELKLKQLETVTLPGAHRLWMLANEQRAQQPTTEEKLQAERDRRQTIRERAEQIANDEESVQEAIRIIEARRAASGLK